MPSGHSFCCYQVTHWTRIFSSEFCLSAASLCATVSCTEKVLVWICSSLEKGLLISRLAIERSFLVITAYSIRDNFGLISK